MQSVTVDHTGNRRAAVPAARLYLMGTAFLQLDFPDFYRIRMERRELFGLSCVIPGRGKRLLLKIKQQKENDS